MTPVMPSNDRSVNRSLPDDTGVRTDSEYKRLYEELRQKEENARTMLRDANGGPVVEPTPSPAETVPTITDPAADLSSQRPKTKVKRFERTEDAEIRPATGVLVFGTADDSAYDETMTVLPAGSFVKATVVSGVEANTLEPYPVLLQLEYAFTGPNRTRIDLSNCFMIAKARANLSTERVIMETDLISCVRENGEHFKSAARGYTAGEDSTFGSTGTFISKQGQVLLAAVLANIAKNAGEAVALAQTTTTLGGSDRAAAATNVTGNQAAFVGCKAVVDGAAMIAQWYLDYAKQLLPSIGIGSGQTVHVVMLESIRVPVLSE